MTRIRQALLDEISRLPHAAVLPPDRVVKWIDGLMTGMASQEQHGGDNQDPMWHVRRLFGIGGSEALLALNHRRKVYSSFDNSLPDMVDQKLLHALPGPPTEHTTRGSVLEYINAVYTRILLDGERDEAAIEQIRARKPDGKYGWLIGNPDDILQIRSKRVLFDYKCPNTAPAPDAPVDEGYRAQVHHYSAVADRAGVQIDGMYINQLYIEGANSIVREIFQDDALRARLAAQIEAHRKAGNDAMADEAERTLKRLGRPAREILLERAIAHAERARVLKVQDPSFYVACKRVHLDTAFQRELIEANDWAWNEHVMKGKRVSFFRRERVELTKEEMQAGQEIAGRLLKAGAMRKAADALYEAAAAEMAALMDGKDLDNKKQPFLGISVRADVDYSKAIEHLSRNGVDVRDLCKPGDYDPDKMAELMKAHGLDPEHCRKMGKPIEKKLLKTLEERGENDGRFETRTVRCEVSRQKEGPAADTVNQARGLATAIMQDWFNVGSQEQPADASTAAYAPTP